MYQQENSNDESSQTADNTGHTTDSYDSGDNEKTEYLREQDRFLPIANISRIMKKSIPSNGKIAKDAKECIQECVSEFVSFITSEASDRCKQEKRKTINGEDILFSMATLGFDNYIEPLKNYLMKYREFSLKNDKDMKNFDLKDDFSNGSNEDDGSMNSFGYN
ncbi:hypothetical protein SSS_07190 [Sarcoptes scabiei]|uniref:Nuclear transcription factor Y subunit beta n=1 Tax=Sarcoptes scabiei TaxID=52283 RepID=A0A132A7Q3_SARSC|nr:hypothetical protein SSS_07190 [Sarcoptes scabiei]KPM07006.1 nuclear transcription factor Y-box subunit beta-like protein [Sarcoptes scabiei]UXI16775.1 ABC transporter G family member 23 [Sarcoptes scabiei]